MSNGRFGIHGGQFIPETLMSAVAELETAYEHYKNDPQFTAELKYLLEEYTGRPSRLYYAEKMTKDLGCTAFCKAEQYEKMRKSVEYQLRTGSVVMLPAYLHVEAIIKQRGGRNIEIKQENGVVNV